MTTYNRGDVVLAKFPYSNGSGAKPRPALVVHNPSRQINHADHILVMITSQLYRTGACVLTVLAASADGIAMGLPRDSMIVADKIVTIDGALIAKQLGVCLVMQQVDTALRSALSL